MYVCTNSHWIRENYDLNEWKRTSRNVSQVAQEKQAGERKKMVKGKRMTTKE